MKKLVWLRGNTAGGGGGDPLNTFTGAIIRFLAKAAKPIVNLSANFTPIQSGTGDPSPTNIRPISGHTGATVVQTGEEHLSKDKTVWGQYGINATGYTPNYARFSPYDFTIPFEKGKTYTITALNFMGNNKTFYCGVGEWDGTNTRIADHGWQSCPYSFTVNNSTETIRIAFRDNAYGDCAEYVAAIGTKLFFTMTEAAPNTVAISFGTTVYGGTLTVNEDGSGQVVADKISQTVDQNSGVQRLDDNRCFAAINAASYVNTDGTTADGHIISDKFANVPNNVTATTPGIPGVLIRANGTHNVVISMRGTGSSLITTEDWNAWLTNNPVQIVYDLATPITIPVTAQQIQTLVGANTVWVNDSNDISVTAYGTAIT